MLRVKKKLALSRATLRDLEIATAGGLTDRRTEKLTVLCREPDKDRIGPYQKRNLTGGCGGQNWSEPTLKPATCWTAEFNRCSGRC